MKQRSGDASQAYLDARHAAFATPRPLLDAMVRRAIGRTPTSLERIVKGNDNEVYLATVAQGREVIVRIHRSGSCTLTEEVWPLAMAHSVGVPVPEVLLVDQIAHDDAALEFMV